MSACGDFSTAPSAKRIASKVTPRHRMLLFRCRGGVYVDGNDAMACRRLIERGLLVATRRAGDQHYTTTDAGFRALLERWSFVMLPVAARPALSPLSSARAATASTPLPNAPRGEAESLRTRTLPRPLDHGLLAVARAGAPLAEATR